MENDTVVGSGKNAERKNDGFTIVSRRDKGRMPIGSKENVTASSRGRTTQGAILKVIKGNPQLIQPPPQGMRGWQVTEKTIQFNLINGNNVLE
ncbi:hypothetical protein Pint_35625 [Pistacia integerrima]|uniref:Uncharacterized protein n=1 Tax=Pistacia integerrima TaxID=434235 RepID=A0ACC0Y5P7_9ROSI|nr:hypothetical protein Pint_35625 [Pistacia integerrima]